MITQMDMVLRAMRSESTTLSGVYVVVQPHHPTAKTPQLWKPEQVMANQANKTHPYHRKANLHPKAMVNLDNNLLKVPSQLVMVKLKTLAVVCKHPKELLTELAETLRET